MAARPLHRGGPGDHVHQPVIDYHLLYAIVLIALAVYYAGNTWGLGRRWADLDIVRKNHWLI